MIDKRRKAVKTYVIINVVITAIAFLIGIYAPDPNSNSKFQTAVIGLLILCWSNLVLMAYQVSDVPTSFEGETDRLIERVDNAISNTLSPLSEEAVTLINVANSEVLQDMHKMRALHHGLAKETHFESSQDLVMQYLIKYHMKNYIAALHDALYNRGVPLPSESRMEAAMQAIKNAKSEIFALSTDTDQWLLPQSEGDGNHMNYIEVNIEAAKRGVQIRRLFVVESHQDHNDLSPTIRDQKEAGMDIRCVLRSELRSELDKKFPDVPLPSNMLICDHEVLTLSTTRKKHNGTLSMKPDDIEHYRTRFLRIWELCKKLHDLSSEVNESGR